MQAAGTTTRFRGTAKECMVFEERGSTPPEVRKFRRSANLEPGKRFQHPSTAKDVESLQLEGRVFGVTSKSSEYSTAELLRQNCTKNVISQLNFSKAEGSYKSVVKEPLGRTYVRGHVLPEQFQQGAPFGLMPKRKEETVKELLFPRITETSSTGSELYKKSHGSYDVGEQKTRRYNVEFDLKKKVYGRKGDAIAFNGVSKNIDDVLHCSDGNEGHAIVFKNAEDHRQLGDLLGKSRNLGLNTSSLPPDTVFGKPSVPHHMVDNWGAAETIRGNYADNDMTNDKDLGCAVMPGFRNISVENRSFGVPSIRNDLPSKPLGRRSMADPQNYGDDPAVKDLVNPPDFADMSIDVSYFHKPQTLDRIVCLFQRIGYNIPDDVSSRIYDIARNGSDMCSVNEFKMILNQYLYACETESTTEWLERR